MKKTHYIQPKHLFIITTLLIGGIIAVFVYSPDAKDESPVPDKIVQVSPNQEIVDGLHVATGLVADQGLNFVIAHCTGCHSAKLITQNRFDKEGWTRVIRWMQETQNLWDLGESEGEIVDYLTKNYAPQGQGRRAPLNQIEWYELEGQ